MIDNRLVTGSILNKGLGVDPIKCISIGAITWEITVGFVLISRIEEVGSRMGLFHILSPD